MIANGYCVQRLIFHFQLTSVREIIPNGAAASPKTNGQSYWQESQFSGYYWSFWVQLPIQGTNIHAVHELPYHSYLPFNHSLG